VLELKPLFVIITPPVFPDPEPDVDFEALLGEITRVSPNWTTPPPTFTICTGPMIAGI
jgi:hypothetical protein